MNVGIIQNGKSNHLEFYDDEDGYQQWNLQQALKKLLSTAEPKGFSSNQTS